MVPIGFGASLSDLPFVYNVFFFHSVGTITAKIHDRLFFIRGPAFLNLVTVTVAVFSSQEFILFALRFFPVDSWWNTNLACVPMLHCGNRDRCLLVRELNFRYRYRFVYRKNMK